MTNNKKNAERVLHPEFAKRLRDAADNNPRIPSLNSGRLVYLAEELKKHGLDVSVETVRKWFAGETRPQYRRTGILAQVLRVDETSLLSDVDVTESKQVETEQFPASLRFVAAMLELEGFHVAFPKDNDATAKANGIDMYGIIHGKMAAITVVIGEKRNGEVVFRVPSKARNNTVLGIVREDTFVYRTFKLDWGEVPATADEVVESTLSSLAWLAVTSPQSLV